MRVFRSFRSPAGRTTDADGLRGGEDVLRRKVVKKSSFAKMFAKGLVMTAFRRVGAQCRARALLVRRDRGDGCQLANVVAGLVRDNARNVAAIACSRSGSSAAVRCWSGCARCARFEGRATVRSGCVVVRHPSRESRVCAGAERGPARDRGRRWADEPSFASHHAEIVATQVWDDSPPEVWDTARGRLRATRRSCTCSVVSSAITSGKRSTTTVPTIARSRRRAAGATRRVGARAHRQDDDKAPSGGPRAGSSGGESGKERNRRPS